MRIRLGSLKVVWVKLYRSIFKKHPFDSMKVPVKLREHIILEKNIILIESGHQFNIYIEEVRSNVYEVGDISDSEDVISSSN